MKKATLSALVAYLNGKEIANLPEIKEELEAELARNEAKAAANRIMYNEAHEVVMTRLGKVPMTAQALYDACKAELPEEFTVSKLRYALLNYWEDEVSILDEGHGAKQFARA